jgi:hypothetical protein
VAVAQVLLDVVALYVPPGRFINASPTKVRMAKASAPTASSDGRLILGEARPARTATDRVQARVSEKCRSPRPLAPKSFQATGLDESTLSL